MTGESRNLDRAFHNVDGLGFARRRRLVVLRAIWWFGNPIVLLLARWLGIWGVLETRGRRTGLMRRVPVAVSRYGPTIWVVVARGSQAAYVRNIAADPNVRIRIKSSWLDGVATLEPAEAQIPDYVGRYPRGAALLFPEDWSLLRIDVQ